MLFSFVFLFLYPAIALAGKKAFLFIITILGGVVKDPPHFGAMGRGAA